MNRIEELAYIEIVNEKHFLNDESIAFEIVNALNEKCTTKNVLEVGPGMGVLTQYLLKNESFQTWAIDIDLESVKWLKEHFPVLQERLILGDFLQINLNRNLVQK